MDITNTRQLLRIMVRPQTKTQQYNNPTHNSKENNGNDGGIVVIQHKLLELIHHLFPKTRMKCMSCDFVIWTKNKAGVGPI